METTPQAALETIADALDREHYVTTLTTGHRPWLTIIRRDTPAIEWVIYAEGGWLWWGWASRIARVTDVDAAVHDITGTLAMTLGAIRASGL